jgi:hypothetical protein
VLCGVAHARLDGGDISARAHEIAAMHEVFDRGDVRGQWVVARHERSVGLARVRVGEEDRAVEVLLAGGVVAVVAADRRNADLLCVELSQVRQFFFGRSGGYLRVSSI